MSLKQRKEIAMWFMLLVGIVITTIQLYRYATNTLSYTYSEIIMNLIAVAFMVYPLWILKVAEKVITKKNSNES